jgi:uncharacterized protein (TIGR00369 family)
VTDAVVPAGFVPSAGRGAFTTHNGPIYHKVDGDAFWHGFHALPRHCNGHGIVHGGWLSSFADGLLGTAVWRATQARAVTLRLNADFLGMVRPGEWVEGSARVTRATRSLAFARAEVTCAGRAVLTAEGVFKLMTGRGSPKATA